MPETSINMVIDYSLFIGVNHVRDEEVVITCNGPVWSEHKARKVGMAMFAGYEVKATVRVL